MLKVTLPAVVTLNDYLIKGIGWSPDAEITIQLVFKVDDRVKVECESVEDLIGFIRAYVNSQPVKLP